MCNLSTLRNEAAAKQDWRCHYCRQPMWNDDPAAVAARYGITLKQAQHLKVTAEHLVARQDGGTDTPDNIVAACTYCNDRRHRRRSPLSPEDYARKVRDRLAKGKWHRMRLT